MARTDYSSIHTPLWKHSYRTTTMRGRKSSHAPSCMHTKGGVTKGGVIGGIFFLSFLLSLDPTRTHLLVELDLRGGAFPVDVRLCSTLPPAGPSCGGEVGVAACEFTWLF